MDVRRWQKVPFLRLADAIVIPGAFLMGMGRLGNFIDGQIVGSVTDVWWAVKFPDAEGFRHPVVLYDGLKNLAADPLPAARCGADRIHPALWLRDSCSGTRVLRIFVDLFRNYPTHRLALGTGQTLNIAMTLLGLGLLARASRLRRIGRLAPRHEAPVPAAGTRPDRAPSIASARSSPQRSCSRLTLPSNWTQDIPTAVRASAIQAWSIPGCIPECPIIEPGPAEAGHDERGQGPAEAGHYDRKRGARGGVRSIDGRLCRGRSDRSVRLQPDPADRTRLCRDRSDRSVRLQPDPSRDQASRPSSFTALRSSCCSSDSMQSGQTACVNS